MALWKAKTSQYLCGWNLTPLNRRANPEIPARDNLSLASSSSSIWSRGSRPRCLRRFSVAWVSITYACFCINKYRYNIKLLVEPLPSFTVNSRCFLVMTLDQWHNTETDLMEARFDASKACIQLENSHDCRLWDSTSESELCQTVVALTIYPLRQTDWYALDRVRISKAEVKTPKVDSKRTFGASKSRGSRIFRNSASWLPWSNDNSC